MNMFSTITLSLVLFASSALALPLSVPEPSIVTKMAISIGVPFDMETSKSSPAAHIVARSAEWAVPSPAAPAWTADPSVWTPSPPAWTDAPQQTWAAIPIPSWAPTQASPTPTPNPSYTWAETHDDSKTTLTNGIICGIVFGGFFALVILVFAIFTTYHRAIKPWYRGRRGKGDIEAAKAVSIASTDAGGVQMTEVPERIHVRSTEDGGFRVVHTSGGISRG
ncbi:hypothetical protein HBI56_137490 [Parastagonospora nodorum]|uniref:Mid2 domain-containing protein n=1 Tax=Phaeosphaeria nodorum (strain SN15 / ATCC MYA-4574 / FGSC 10173) TaxID=321614 RepID=A0A7U2NP99_PHANO|nr:hypothetical protein HBH56_130320 [Parastagonospora nodorum]QRD05535.1 hypothetical protein JI435_058170 [Parastagonospora nodorum SN15]KAH3931192.1 hypothetical protein HBH54_093180 [Parastagonospora nodorum]KAH3947317.1 hypothetical protein HBH53_120680 [Parastagonospora nodorum]KAH3996475.1 hypothetical protein HBI10_158430 [Parastagonospora nodorum]